MGSGGYALLIEHGIEIARKFAAEIEKRPNFQLVTAPELNILTYRLNPLSLIQEFSASDVQQQIKLNEHLNNINRTVQRLQREAGRSFVSRTTLQADHPPGQDMVVLRCVIMNPMTDIEILREILDEQEKIYKQAFDLR